MSDSFFTIGTIVKAQGIRGEVRVMPSTDDPKRFSLLDRVRVGGTWYNVERARQHNTLVIMKLENINDRNTAEKLVGGVLEIPPEAALPLADDEYYIRDLIGMQAVDEAENILGTITQVLHTGANDVYVIAAPEGKFMIPAIKDVIIQVDIAAQKVIVRMMDGLRELMV